jgi:acyl dehydratase
MKFQDVQIGTAIGPEEIFISKDQTRAYAHANHLPAARFTDDELAKKEGLPGMILPGNMSLALLAKLVTDWIAGNPARMVRLGTTYRVPVQPDHKLVLNGFLTNTNPTDRTAEIDVWMENEEGERLVTGTATVKFPK